VAEDFVSFLSCFEAGKMPPIDADSSVRKTSRRVAKGINGVLSRFYEEDLKPNVRRSLVYTQKHVSPFALI
jgi:hypothetical protein